MIARMVLNGRPRELDVRPEQTLLEALRDTLGIFDVKEGCGEGVCGVCTVLLDGRPVSSCLVLAPAVRGRAVTTLRGLERDGYLSRTVTPSIPPRVDYALTDLGRDLLEPIRALEGFARRNQDRIATARLAFDSAG